MLVGWRLLPEDVTGLYSITDGNYTRWNYEYVLDWGHWFRLSNFNPFSGLGSTFWTNTPWLNPGAWVLQLPLSIQTNITISYLMHLLLFLVSLYCLGFISGASPLAILFSGLVFVVLLSPLYEVLGHHCSCFHRAVSPRHDGCGELHDLLDGHCGAWKAAPRIRHRGCRRRYSADLGCLRIGDLFRLRSCGGRGFFRHSPVGCAPPRALACDGRTDRGILHHHWPGRIHRGPDIGVHAGAAATRRLGEWTQTAGFRRGRASELCFDSFGLPGTDVAVCALHFDTELSALCLLAGRRRVRIRSSNAVFRAISIYSVLLQLGLRFAGAAEPIRLFGNFHEIAVLHIAFAASTFIVLPFMIAGDWLLRRARAFAWPMFLVPSVAAAAIILFVVVPDYVRKHFPSIRSTIINGGYKGDAQTPIIRYLQRHIGLQPGENFAAA